MRFGICASPNYFKTAEEVGYDYFETNFSNLARMSESDFNKFKKLVDSSNIKVEAFNGAFPNDIKITSKNADFNKIINHVETGCKRASLLGGKVVVLGSGSARRVEDNDFESAEKIFIRVLDVFTSIAEKYGIMVVLENLNSNETNFINTLKDEIRIIKKSGNDKIKCLVDFFHFEQEKENVETVENCYDIYHVHLCSMERSINIENDLNLLQKWKKALDVCDYNKRISIECMIYEDTVINSTKQLDLLKKIFE